MVAQRGFTLFELMVVLAILSVLLFFAYPAFLSMMQKLESQTVRRHIHEALRLAKLESHAQGDDVIVCMMNDDKVCNKTAQGNLVVFVDKNYDNRFSGKDVFIYQQPLSLKYGMIEMNVSAGRNYIKFMSDTGKPRGNFGHIKYCNLQANKSLDFRVVINMHGVVSDRRGNLVDVGCAS